MSKEEQVTKLLSSIRLSNASDVLFYKRLAEEIIDKKHDTLMLIENAGLTDEAIKANKYQAEQKAYKEYLMMNGWLR